MRLHDFDACFLPVRTGGEVDPDGYIAESLREEGVVDAFIGR